MRGDPPPVLVRPASPNDAEAAAELLRHEARFARDLDPWFELRPDYDWPALVRRLLAHSSARLLVAERQGRLEGLVVARVARPPGPPRPDRRPWLRRLLRPRRSPRPRPPGPLEPAVWGVIESLWVEAPSRRQGIGRELVVGAESWLRDQGAVRLRLGVAADNEEARRFWQQLGFRPYRVRYLREL